MEKTPTRKCIRMNNYDYSTAGAYFVTICIDKRKPILWAKNTDHKPSTSVFTVISTILGQTKRWTSMKLGYSIRQKSFYDHVIRNYQDYRETWEYIENNPLKHLLKQSSQIL